jgi:hypothetical protein
LNVDGAEGAQRPVTSAGLAGFEEREGGKRKWSESLKRVFLLLVLDGDRECGVVFLDRTGLDWMLVYPLWLLLGMHCAIDLLKDELLNSDM